MTFDTLRKRMVVLYIKVDQVKCPLGHTAYAAKSNEKTREGVKLNASRLPRLPDLTMSPEKNPIATASSTDSISLLKCWVVPILLNIGCRASRSRQWECSKRMYLDSLSAGLARLSLRIYRLNSPCAKSH